MDYRSEQQCAYDQDRLCPNVIRLEAKVDAIEEWRDEISKRLAVLNGMLDKIMLAVLGTLASSVLGLLYIILERTLK